MKVHLKIAADTTLCGRRAGAGARLPDDPPPRFRRALCEQCRKSGLSWEQLEHLGARWCYAANRPRKR